MKFNITFDFPDEIPAAELYVKLRDSNLKELDTVERHLYSLTNEADLYVDMQNKTGQNYLIGLRVSKFIKDLFNDSIISEYSRNTDDYSEKLKYVCTEHEHFIDCGKILRAINEWYTKYHINQSVDDDSLGNFVMYCDPNDPDSYIAVICTPAPAYTIQTTVRGAFDSTTVYTADDFITKLNEINPNTVFTHLKED